MNTEVYQWENENSLRSFPFLEDTDLVDDSGARLPDGIISDLSVFVQTSVFSSKTQIFQLRVSCIYIGPELLSVSLVRENSGVLSITLSKSDLVPWQPYMLTPVADGYAGYITFADFLWPNEPHNYTFSKTTQAVLDIHALYGIDGPGVKAFVDVDNHESVSGFVEFIFPGIIKRTIKKIEREGYLGYYVDLNLAETNTLAGPCDALSTSQKLQGVCGVPVVTSIAGVKPNEDGTIMLRFK